VVEKEVIKTLMDQGVIVITVGGGGIPVVKKDNQLVGVEAVIDKDFASAKVAQLVDADYLFILTAVDRVMINYNQPDQKSLEEISVAQAREYINEGHFAPGSMLPKVEAAISFVENNSSKTSVIAALEKAKAALRNESGTKIVS
jgi:carbamate kinase